jgi:hypothetical protein
VIFFFDGSAIEHGAQRRRTGRKFLSLIKRLRADLADVIHAHQSGRVSTLRWRQFGRLRRHFRLLRNR